MQLTGHGTPKTLSDTPSRRRVTFRRLLLAAIAALILGIVFAAYLQPAFVLDLANRFILCL
ncbi:MAG: hypothetical protein H7327_05035 [Herminiimonas sp.]|nr:hypothetical protein [Herminiimonas sp.]